MKKILCLCDYGQVRSVAMATVLRERGHFAVAGSFDSYSNYFYRDGFSKPDLAFPILFDKIIVMQEGGEHFIGRDEWGDPTNKELISRCGELADDLGL